MMRETESTGNRFLSKLINDLRYTMVLRYSFRYLEEMKSMGIDNKEIMNLINQVTEDEIC